MAAADTFDSQTADRVAHFFRVATFVHATGVRFAGCGPGWCETTLDFEPRHAQQDGFVHAGVLATMADHTAGGAAGTCARADQGVLSVEFKINLLSPVSGGTCVATAEIRSMSRRLAVVSISIENNDRLVALAQGTSTIVAPK